MIAFPWIAAELSQKGAPRRWAILWSAGTERSAVTAFDCLEILNPTRRAHPSKRCHAPHSKEALVKSEIGRIFRVLKRALFPAVAGVVLCGCLSAARKLEPSVVDRIDEGASTRAMVEKLLGKPEELEIGSNRKMLARYTYGQPLLSTEASRYEVNRRPGAVGLRTLTLLYSPNGTVERKVYDESVTPVERTRDFVITGQRVSSVTLERLQKGVTTREGVLELLGEPTERTLNVAGEEIFLWFYVRDNHRHRGLKRDFQRVLVQFNERGRVKDYAVFDNPDQVPMLFPR